ncbi:sigma-70 family RNA polymerase sigma factor [Streptomyces roseicoloratus]|uniref:RNA polymerase sigma factor n=2 Tax=Streptomyces roseicoloratus TaxID=2508722 RepID=A0ABY9S1K5_9ACTN|nr:sigma-70 family RNA polymerase sigma factor [Streptomyces roseicoloratus]WMX48310.1 sigma-70 family RNA polymerase sigma factor [Streptomyces roseicoloratus]
MEAPHGTELVRAAQGGDPEARDRLVAAYLPLVYNIVGRAMNGHHDVDDVVQETMLRALDGLGGLRSPDGFRSWLVAIAMNTLRTHWHRQQARHAAGTLDEARDMARPGADFVELTVVRLQLSGQRRETAEATRWLEPEDNALLSLWWLECAGELTRHEVAAALEIPTEHAGVRIQRMKERLESARVVVRALSATPLCPTLRESLGIWDGRPSALWRKRIARHARGCAHCAGLWHGLVPAEGLLAGLLLVPPAALLLGAVREAAGLGPTALAGATTAATATTAPTATVAPAVSGQGGHGRGRHAAHAAAPATRGARRKERERKRGQRRAAAAAGLAVFAVTGGTFYLTNGPEGGDPDAVDVTRAAAPDTGSALEPAGTDPATLSSTPSASSSTARPSRTAKPSPKPTKPATTKPAPPRTTTPPPPSPRPTATGGSGPTSSSDAAQVIELANAERAKAGCGPLTEHTLLTRAAQGHSDDMAARDFFDHTNPDGADPGDRVTAAGYRWSTYGENIAMGQRTPADVMEAWMNSPGHRANILNCSFKEIGIGIHTAGGPYWTQVFGAR